MQSTGMSSACLSKRIGRQYPSCSLLKKKSSKYFGMDLEFLLRRKPKWKAALQSILFREGEIVALGDQGERAEQKVTAGEK